MSAVKRKYVNLIEDVAQVCLCVASILGEFQRGDPVTDPQLRGSVRISPPSCTSLRTHLHTHAEANKSLNDTLIIFIYA